MQELTSRQQEVLDFVCRFRDEHGCPLLIPDLY
jgi:hypothetical protein